MPFRSLLERFGSELKPLKYAFKQAVLARRPQLYWGLRRALRGFFEPEHALLPALVRPGSVVVDVGSNFGAWTHHLLEQQPSTVHAFEANPELAALLGESYRGDGRVVVHGVALSDRADIARFQIPRRALGYASLDDAAARAGMSDSRGGHETWYVRCERLDDQGLSGVGFIKIDVEGHEFAVLEGARELLRRDHPALIIECEERHRKGTVAAVIGLLAELGYSPWELDRERLVPVVDHRPNQRNLVFLPPDQALDRLTAAAGAR